MKSKYKTHQNTQCEDVKCSGKPNVQNEAFGGEADFALHPELLQSNESVRRICTGIFGSCGSCDSLSAVGVFVCRAFIVWSHLSTQLHQKLHNKASLQGINEYKRTFQAVILQKGLSVNVRLLANYLRLDFSTLDVIPQKQSSYLFCVHNEVHFVVATVYLEVLVRVSKLPHECAIL